MIQIQSSQGDKGELGRVKRVPKGTCTLDILHCKHKIPLCPYSVSLPHTSKSLCIAPACFQCSYTKAEIRKQR